MEHVFYYWVDTAVSWLLLRKDQRKLQLFQQKIVFNAKILAKNVKKEVYIKKMFVMNDSFLHIFKL